MISSRVKRYAAAMTIFFFGSVTGIGAFVAYVWITVPAEEAKNCSEDEWDDVRPRFRSFLQAVVAERS